jgi:membrane dipeptidase
MNEDEKAKESEPFRPLLEEFAGTVAGVRPTVADVANHIDYLVELLGIGHVAVGSDYDGMMFPPLGLEDCSKLPNPPPELIRRGYPENHIKKILGGNFLRVFGQVCG